MVIEKLPLRIVIKENMSFMLAQDFLNEVRVVLAELDGKEDKLSKPRRGKNIPH